MARLALASAIAALVLAAGAAEGMPPESGTREHRGEVRTDDRQKPVVFVHGLDWTGDAGWDCSKFGDMRAAFTRFGHTGGYSSVAYYRHDNGCDHWISHHGKHENHYGGSGEHEADGNHDANTDIRHLGYHFAWYLWRHYSSEGVAVDVVGHSMGGLIIRYALAQTEAGHERFPSHLLVEDVVTLGTPHGGARWYSIGCGKDQCGQMQAGSDFLVWLEEHAWEPDGRDGTDWSTFGSDDDNAVAADRAAGSEATFGPGNDEPTDEQKYIGSCHKVWYRSPANIEHSDFLTVRSGEREKETDADVHRFNCEQGTWVEDDTSHWPVRRADLAVTFGNR